MTELQPLLNLLGGKFGWLPAVCGYITAFRVPLKFFSASIQKNLTTRMAAAATSADTEDRQDFDALLRARWYRVLNFTLDLVFSFKLPTHADFVLLSNQPNQKVSRETLETAGGTPALPNTKL